MNKTIIIIATVCSVLMFLDTVNAANSLILFLFAGVIPGTEIRVSPVDMMAASATAITVVIMRLTLWTKIRSIILTTTDSGKSERTKRMPRPIT